MKRQSLDVNSLGEKHKSLERIFAGQRLIPGITTIARLDGRAFHTLLRNAKKPFDLVVIGSMQETAKELLDKFQADISYVQSDEITLVWRNLELFDCKIQKMVSVLASMASVTFNKFAYDHLKELGTFDCRIWQVSSMEMAAENLLWRELDATKNSVSMLASHYFTDSELFGKHTKERVSMLEAKGIMWATLPHWTKKGSYYIKKDVETLLTKEELEKIPERHRPSGPILRSKILMLEIPPATEIQNLAGVFFNQENPLPHNID